MIFTLPITVKDRALLGYWLTPILTDALSQQFQERGILCYGRLGLHRPTLPMENTFYQRIGFLSLTCNCKPDSDFKDGLLDLLQEVYTEGTIERREQQCYRCSCGCLELPVHIAPFAKEKTFTRVGNNYICRVCEKAGEVALVSGRFFQIGSDWSLESICVYPEWYRRELRDLVHQIREQGIPLSRTRTTGLRQEGINLDIEFVWSLIPLLFSRQYPGERIRLVITNHVLRQAATALLLAQALNPDLKADLIISPCITLPGVSEKWNVDRLIELGFTGDLLRFILIGSLGWQTKDAHLYDAPSAIEYRRFVLLKRRVQEARERASLTPYTPDEALRNLCQQNLAQGLRNVFNPERFKYQTLIGLF